jgi:NAD(P)-dependent dehydrogenase (short-subunit alcohol dehydrogenase family)
MTGLLAGQVAVVTGAARGQGRSHALALAKEGASIIALDACAPIATVPYPLATKADLETTAEQVEALGSRVIHGVVDVRDLAEMDQFIRDAVADLGRLDIVCANAGISTPSSTLEMT